MCYVFSNLCWHCFVGGVEAGFVLGCFDSSVNNPRTSSSTPSQKYLICYGPNKKQNNSSQIEDVYDKMWAHVNSSLLLSSGAQLDFSVAVSRFWSSLTPLFLASWTSCGAISLPGKTEETIWCSSRGVIPGSHLPVSHTQVYIKVP